MNMWDLNQEAFYQLLARLNTDPEQGGEAYEMLRARLIFLFGRKGCRISAELADETINRVARKIEEGHEIGDLFKYSHGVARLVLLEHWKDPRREWEQLDERLAVSEKGQEFDPARLECMKRCLQNLSSEGRNLIIRNCTLNKDGKEELARSLGLTVNALRRRVFRIRTELHACCEKCVKKA